MDKKILFASFVLFYTLFFKFSLLNQTFAGWLNNGLILMFLIVNKNMFKRMFDREYRILNILLLLWAILVAYSGFVNQNMSFDVEKYGAGIVKTLYSKRADHSLYYAVKILALALYFQTIARQNKSQIFIRYFYKFMFVYVLVSNINVLTYYSPDGMGFWAGNKFYVSYLNLFVATLYPLVYPCGIRKHSIRVKFLLFMSFLIAFKTECSTAVIGSLVMAFLLFSKSQMLRNKLFNWRFFMLGLFVLDVLFFFFTMAFIENPIMQYIIVDLLGEDMTLTGRVEIYARMAEILSEIPLCGYGIGNYHLFAIMSGIGANAQNGLFNLMLEIGIIGVLLYFLIVCLLLSVGNKSQNSYPIVCLIYVMLLLSSVEVTFTATFFIMSLMLLLYDRRYQKVSNY